jgi:peptide/nickel transport system substrate-binding protein
MEGYRALNRKISDNAYVLPMFQYYQPVLHRKDLAFQSHAAGYVMPSLFKKIG